MRLGSPGSTSRARWTAVVGASALSVLLTGCGDGRSEWCESLSGLSGLDDLVAAVGAEDPSAASDALADLEELASEAPGEIRSDMEAVVTLVGEVVEIRLASDDVDEAELELRRERVNQDLAQITVHTAEVSTWAERECGIRLD